MRFLKDYLPNQNIVVLLSAGSDSTAVLHFLSRRHNVSAAHFNHGTTLAPTMETAAREFCESLGVGLKVGRTNKKLKTEGDFREARLNWLMEEFSDTNFITGHHIGDAVESHVLNFIRGQENYRPIPLVSEFKNSNKIWRPFIVETKDSLRRYAAKNNLLRFIVEDLTNFESKGSRRAMIRNEILPIFNRDKVGLETIVRKKMLLAA